MNESIFSTYSTGENRVTASILAVLQCLSLSRIEAILGAILDADVELVRFRNQISGGGKGIPDGEIASSFRLLIETKRVRNRVTKDQLERHLERLNESNENHQMVLVLTPDEDKPEAVAALKDNRLAWNSFAALNQAIDELLGNEEEVISEREEFLLRELQKMLLAENLLGSSKDVLVIPARNAWPLYREYGINAYICQEGRAFQPVKYIAFYEQNQIHEIIPFILDKHDHVAFERGKNGGRLGELVDRVLHLGERPDWPFKVSVGKVFLLSAPDASETVRLSKPVINNLTSESGQKIAFTQNQRYVSLDALQRAAKTSDLKDDSR